MKLVSLFYRTLLALSVVFSGGVATANANDHVGTQNLPAELRETTNLHHPNERHYTSGQPTEQQLQAFAEHGVRHVVDLRPPAEDRELNNAAQVSRAGMAYYHIPIGGREDFTRDHVATLDTILQRIGDDQALFHCASSNRVGALMALHAVWFEGANEEEAIAKGKAYGLTSLEEAVRASLTE